MATKTAKKNSKQSTVDLLKTKAANFNEIALKTSNEIVEETIAAGEQWQNLLAKTVKKGTVLFGKQQDLMLDHLELLKDQYGYGAKRLRKLFTFKPLDESTPKAGSKPSAKTAKTDQNIDEVMDAVTKSEKAPKPAAAKKASPAKAATAKKLPSTTANSNNLTLIEGIGPKIQELLNKAGIATFEQLAITSPDTLKKILDDAGSRFQMHDPSTWAAQAKLAAAGRMDELKVLQAELKGGK